MNANSHLRLTLDRKTLTTAYPELTVSGGKGSRIVLTYSEALYDNKEHKGDRDSLSYTARKDPASPPSPRPHRPLSPRRWTPSRVHAPLVAHLALSRPRHHHWLRPAHAGITKAYFTAYPFAARANIRIRRRRLDKIWETSWRTARVDAHETYMDTPYYEQLQYIGDTRIQALISYTVAGDDRLGSPGHHRVRRLSDSRRHHAQPLSEQSSAKHPDLLPALDRHAPRLLDVPARS